MGKKIVVISDLHLGCDRCDKKALNEFLDSLQKRDDVTDLVLLGDVVDMWRRDASGVYLENREIINKLVDMPQHVKVHYLAGNHDRHVLRLKNDKPFIRYPFDFQPDLELKDDPYIYRFEHGHEFEYGPEKDDPTMYAVMEALCRAMSDEQGDVEDHVWNFFTRTWTDMDHLLAIFNGSKEREVRGRTRRLRDGPKERLKESDLKKIDEKAGKAQGGRPNYILVYGHTHRPFINKDEKCGQFRFLGHGCGGP